MHDKSYQYGADVRATSRLKSQLIRDLRTGVVGKLPTRFARQEAYRDPG